MTYYVYLVFFFIYLEHANYITLTMKMKVDWGCVSFETQNVLNYASTGYEH